jgi:hypothetical protein
MIVNHFNGHDFSCPVFDQDLKNFYNKTYGEGGTQIVDYFVNFGVPAEIGIISALVTYIAEKTKEVGDGCSKDVFKRNGTD